MAFRKIVAIAVASLVLASAGLTTSASAAPAAPSSQAECPEGYACLYKGVSWDSHPFIYYYYYGYYNLTDVSGPWLAWNHQTGAATMLLCTGLNGTGCSVQLNHNVMEVVWSMEDYKSIRLQP